MGFQNQVGSADPICPYIPLSLMELTVEFGQPEESTMDFKF